MPVDSIRLDYPIDPRPRYGHGRPPHERLYAILAEHRGRYAASLHSFLRYKPHLLRIGATVEDPDSEEPQWVNDYLPGMDAVCLYAMLAERRPARYVEVGSGNSTRFARRAIRDHGLSTTVTSIDPFPRASCDRICDRVVRQRLEELDLALFDELRAGDVLFVDHSHRVFMNSDTVVTFLDVLPRLRSGVLVHFHDIWLPYDYPPNWSTWFFAEQYMLACWLLAGTGAFDVLLANGFCSFDSELVSILNPLWEEPGFQRVSRGGGSFWVEMA